MDQLEFTLANNVSVQVTAEMLDLDTMVAFAKSKEYLQETEDMLSAREIYPHPAANLVVYDDMLAVGLTNAKGIITGILDYTDSRFLDWIDQALSWYNQPMRIVDRTTNGTFSERMKPRTSMNWIAYDEKAKILFEVPGLKCSAYDYFKSLPNSDNLYVLKQMTDGSQDKVEIIHFEMLKGVPVETPLGPDEGVAYSRVGYEHIPGTVEQVKKTLREKHNDALIIELPLDYCAHANDISPSACIANIWVEVYTENLGFVPFIGNAMIQKHPASPRISKN